MQIETMNHILEALGNVRWHETKFADLQWFSPESSVYILRCKAGTPQSHYIVLSDRSLDEAISKAVFTEHKSESVSPD